MQGTVIYPMLLGSHYDDTKWCNPNEFMPERYLDTTGNLSLKSDLSLPFGAGKRIKLLF